MSDVTTTTRQELVPIQAEIYRQPLTVFVGQINKGTEILKGISVVDNQQSLENAAEMLNKAKTLSSFITKKVDEICRPLKDMKADIDEVQRNIKAYADEISSPLTNAGKELEAKIIEYHKIQKAESDRIRKINDDMIREAEEKRRQDDISRAKEKQQAEINGIELPPQEPPASTMVMTTPVIEPPKIKGMTTIWKYEITHPALIPLEYMTPDTAKINAAVKGGSRNIPGIRIYEEQIIKKS